MYTRITHINIMCMFACVHVLIRVSKVYVST